MSGKRFKAEEIVNKLREADVLLSQGKTKAPKNTRCDSIAKVPKRGPTGREERAFRRTLVDGVGEGGTGCRPRDNRSEDRRL